MKVLLLFRWLLLFFIVVPIVEMYLLLTVGGIIGVLPTIALVVLTAVIGVTLLRQQGLATLQRAQARMAQGGVPAAEMADGLLLAVAGPLLVTPGFATDAMGFALLTPPVRRWLGRTVVARMFIVGPAGGPAAGGGGGMRGPGPGPAGPRPMPGA
ncbi:MAG: FxsA family protein, partial [Pseudomonadota bacterium]